MKRTLRHVGMSLICSVLVFAQNSPTGAGRTEGDQKSGTNIRESQQAPTSKALPGGVEVLSDTMGVDFSPYLQPMLKNVKQNWYRLSPPIARAPRMLPGEVAISFAILKSGKVAGMKLLENSGNVPLDRAAWGAISDSRFSPLPAEFSGEYLALRFHFVYNPSKPSDAFFQYRERSRP